MEMRFGTWNVISMYSAGSVRAVAEKISKYKLDLVEVQEVRWDRGGTEPAGEYTFFPFSELLNVRRVSDGRQIELRTAEPLVPDPSPFEVEIAIAK
jgi:hypothetical protein